MKQTNPTLSSSAGFKAVDYFSFHLGIACNCSAALDAKVLRERMVRVRSMLQSID